MRVEPAVPAGSGGNTESKQKEADMPDDLNKARKHLTDVEDVVGMLRKTSIFGGLSDDQLGSVFKELRGLSFRKGDVIFRQGEKPDDIYIIRSGKIRIFMDANGVIVDLVTFGVGECFGETSALGVVPHSASATAMEDAELIVISMQSLHDIYKRDPRLFGFLIMNLAREACLRLHDTDQYYSICLAWWSTGCTGGGLTQYEN
jgi:signal-transduction protein with cAMP-binding, CBS, and nucleotidyltransferase domain